MSGPASAGAPGPLRMLLAWLLVVVVTGAATTWVVTRVGQDVAGELRQPVPTIAATAERTPPAVAAGRPGASGSETAPTGPGPTDDGQPGSGPEPTGTPVASVPPSRPSSPSSPGAGATRQRDSSPGSAPEPTAGGGSPSSPEPTRGDSEDATTAAPRPSPAVPSPRRSTVPRPTPVAATGTFSVAGGTIAVRCPASGPVTRSVTPGDGYRFEVEVDREKATVKVTFSNESREDHLVVGCRGGVPVRSSEED